MQDILAKIKVVAGKGASHIVVFMSAFLNHGFGKGQYPVIAARAVQSLPHGVVDLFTAVNAEYHIVHVFIYKVTLVLIQKKDIGGYGKAEILFAVALPCPGIVNYPLYHIKIHEGFSAKEIHFKVPPVPGVFNKKIYRPHAYLKAHQGAFSQIFTRPCKAVFAPQVAVMGYVEAKGFYNGIPGPLGKVLLIYIPGKKQTFADKGPDLINRFPDLPLRKFLSEF